VALARVVTDFGPADWDRTFVIARRVAALGAEGGITLRKGLSAAGLAGLSLAAEYRWEKYRLRGERLCQIRAADYRL